MTISDYQLSTYNFPEVTIYRKAFKMSQLIRYACARSHALHRLLCMEYAPYTEILKEVYIIKESRLQNM